MPSRSGLLWRFLIAAIAGSLIVVCVVMPAEYRKDPTGFGRMVGLLELTKPKVAAPAPSDATPDDKPANGVVSHYYEQPFKIETVKVRIGPDGEVEYKAKMKAGQALMYSWEVDKGSVYYDFHGGPADPKQSKRYLEVQETKNANGAFVAPFDGKHGWYWLNLSAEPIVVTVKLSGFYESFGLVE
jgi:hypothetical protein